MVFNFKVFGFIIGGFLGFISSVVLVEYRGLSVKEVTELRRALREEDVEFKVYRNAIARRAAEKLGHEDFAKT